MTTIIGYVEPATGKTWVGWDSRVTDGHGSIYHIEHEKVRQFGRWWIGCSGSAASLDVIEQSRRLTHEPDDSHEVARLIQQAFCAADFKKCDQHAGPPCYEQELLLVRHGEIWRDMARRRKWRRPPLLPVVLGNRLGGRLCARCRLCADRWVRERLPRPTAGLGGAAGLGQV